MSAAPIASGARAELVMTAHPTVKTSPKAPMNSVTYLRTRDPPYRGRAACLLKSGLRVPNWPQARAGNQHLRSASTECPEATVGRRLGRPCRRGCLKGRPAQEAG